MSWDDKDREEREANARLIAAAPALLSELKSLREEVEALRAALTPSAETKAAYMGEFRFKFSVRWEGEEIDFMPTVPWTTIKEIMAAIQRQALRLNPKGK